METFNLRVKFATFSIFFSLHAIRFKPKHPHLPQSFLPSPQFDNDSFGFYRKKEEKRRKFSLNLSTTIWC